MIISFFNNQSDEDVYNKNISFISSVRVEPTEDFDILQPHLILQCDNKYMLANYIFIDTYDRYYFIRDKKLLTAERIELICEVDPLKSANLDNCPISVVRNGGISKPTEIPDNKLPILPNEIDIKQTVDTNSALTTNAQYCYVLGCIGGEIT